MKAVVVQQYGGPEVASIQERPSPSITPHELLVRVEAVAVTSGDARIRGARFPRGFSVPGRLALGLRGPRNPVLGAAFSGVVEKVGASVEGFAPGDEIAGMNGAKMGAHAQLAAISTRSIAHKPAAVSHLDAAGVLFGGTTALRFLDGRVRPGRKRSGLRRLAKPARPLAKSAETALVENAPGSRPLHIQRTLSKVPDAGIAEDLPQPAKRRLPPR